MTDSDLFNTHHVPRAILLVDASGSVMMNKINNVFIFEQMQTIIKTFEEEEFRILFWNSDNNVGGDHFARGIYTWPAVYKRSAITQPFFFTGRYINGSCLTFPHLAFNSIPETWMSQTEINKIYFITDGEMGYGNIDYRAKLDLQRNLKESIQNLFRMYSNVQLNIITIEGCNRDFTQAESLGNAAGCDVYNVIMNNKLTSNINKFVSYTPNNMSGFVHINKNIPPPGCIPFGDKFFHETKTNQFILHLNGLIRGTTEENDLLQLVQYLSSTVCHLTRDKPSRIRDDIVKTFSGLFHSTCLDIMFVRFILLDAISKEAAGMSNIFASYRSQLKDLYKKANELLQQNVTDAIGVQEQFVTMLVNDRVVCGHFRLIDKSVSIDRQNFPHAAIKIGSATLPVLPFQADLSAMNEQCLRQWVRAVVHRLYNVNVQDDIVIYLVLGMVLRVVTSDVPAAVKAAYKRLGLIMLKKKRLNTNRTELEKLQNGELPIPNDGRIESFYQFMTTVSRELNLTVHPMTMWYLLCMATGDSQLIAKQFVHCADLFVLDFPDATPSLDLIKLKPVTFHQIPFENVLDYTCIITLEDTSAAGGYKFMPHQTVTGSTCSPVYVLSVDGHKQLTSEHRYCICPICYTQLTDSHFKQVGPKAPLDTELDKVFTEMTDLFGQQIVTAMAPAARSRSTPAVRTRSTPATAAYPTLNKTGTLIMMKGTVGSGKTMFAEKIKAKIEEAGCVCLVESTDKYVRTGSSITEAINLVKTSIQSINDLPSDKLIYLIIDMCNERDTFKNPVVFDTDFTGWKKVLIWPNLERKKIAAYLAWTLRNILRRTAPSDADNYCLNPVTSGFDACINVHRNKASSLGRRLPNIFSFNQPTDVDSAIIRLNVDADAYQLILDNQLTIEAQMQSFMKRIMQ